MWQKPSGQPPWHVDPGAIPEEHSGVRNMDCTQDISCGRLPGSSPAAWRAIAVVRCRAKPAGVWHPRADCGRSVLQSVTGIGLFLTGGRSNRKPRKILANHGVRNARMANLRHRGSIADIRNGKAHNCGLHIIMCRTPKEKIYHYHILSMAWSVLGLRLCTKFSAIVTWRCRKIIFDFRP